MRYAVCGMLLLLVMLAGCKSPAGGGDAGSGGSKGEAILLTVDFEPGQTLRYAFVSHRDIALDWAPGAEAGAGRVQKQSERLEMVVAYTPIEVDPYGVSTLVAVCESVKATRSGGPSGRSYGSDAVETAQGRTFTLKVDPRGRIVGRSDLDKLLLELGEAAFQPDSGRGRVKAPDMIADFIAGQWFLWDMIASIANPSEGVTLGQRWSSQLSVPTPMVIRKARNVTYQLAEIRKTEDEHLAVIDSSYGLADAVPASWPIPYAGRFRMSGTFGFLGSYQIAVLIGSGEAVVDVEAGRLETSRQTYTMEMNASLPPMGIRANPHITLAQTLTVERIRP